MDVELLDYISENTEPPTPERPEGFGITVREYATEKCGGREHIAREILDKCVEDGILEKIKMRQQGKGTGAVALIYYKPGTLTDALR